MKLKLILALLLLTSYAPAQEAAPRPIYGPEPTPWADIWEVKNAELSPGLAYRLHKKARFDADVSQVFEEAGEKILKEADRLTPGTLWCVLMDVDDTILDHGLHQRMMEETGQSFDSGVWRGWIEAKKAPLLAGAKTFMELIRYHGGRIILISNLHDYEELHARQRLADLGIHQGEHYSHFLTRTWKSPSAKPERHLVVPALTRLTDRVPDSTIPVSILGSIGDQMTDKMDGVAFFAIPQGSREHALYGDPAVGRVPSKTDPPAVKKKPATQAPPTEKEQKKTKPTPAQPQAATKKAA